MQKREHINHDTASAQERERVQCEFDNYFINFHNLRREAISTTPDTKRRSVNQTMMNAWRLNSTLFSFSRNSLLIFCCCRKINTFASERDIVKSPHEIASLSRRWALFFALWLCSCVSRCSKLINSRECKQFSLKQKKNQWNFAPSDFLCFQRSKNSAQCRTQESHQIPRKREERNEMKRAQAEQKSEGKINKFFQQHQLSRLFAIQFS